MKKIVICDDEIKLCQLLTNIIDWKSLNIEIAGIANDGLSAFDMISSIKPDIVLTDIRMPGIDGIELIRRVKEEVCTPQYNINFIIISGYKLFDYAHNAIKYGVEDYLLKPIEEDELTKILMKIINKIDKSDSHKLYVDNLEKKLKSDSASKKKHFLLDIFNSGNVPSQNDISDKYDITFSKPLFVSALVHPVLNESQLSESSQKIMIQKAYAICEKTFGSLNLDFYMHHETYGVYILFNVDTAESKELNKNLAQITHNIKYMDDLFPDIKTHIGKSSVSEQHTDILSLLNEAKIAAFSYIKSPSAPVVSYDEQSFEFPKTDAIPPSLYIDFDSSIEHLNLSKLNTTIDSIKNAYMAYNPCGYSIMLFYVEIFKMFVNKSVLFNLPVDNDELKLFESKVPLYSSSSETYRQLKTLIADKMNLYVKKRDESSSNPINDIKIYIQNNFEKSISLEKLSDIFGFNPSYISQLFRSETGMNFKDYLLDIRLSEAKRLLQYTDDSIEDISLSIGYSDYKHFSKLFKKHTDLSPQKYRNLYHI